MNLRLCDYFEALTPFATPFCTVIRLHLYSTLDFVLEANGSAIGYMAGFCFVYRDYKERDLTRLCWLFAIYN